MKKSSKGTDSSKDMGAHGLGVEHLTDEHGHYVHYHTEIDDGQDTVGK